MYNNVKYRVKTNNCLTEDFNSKIGVKQGCNLSPTLFFFFKWPLKFLDPVRIDAPIILDSLSINCLLYADDLLLISESKSGLQNSG